jgi:hypothetical protein
MSAMCALLPGPSGWPSRLPGRCAVALLGMLLAGASCGPGQSPPATTIVAQPPLQLTSSSYEQIALPTPVSDTQDVVVSPVDPATLFACTAHLQLSGPGGSASPQAMTLWRSTDTGAHWTRSTLQLGSGTQCRISIAPDDPRRMTLQVTQSEQGTQPCAHDVFYRSGDSGVTWRPLPPHTSLAPPDAVSGWCDLHTTARHVYLAYSYTPASQAPQVSLLERSDDDGTTWMRADRGLGDGALFFMPDVGPGDTLAMPVAHPSAQAGPTTTELWTSPDAGQTWRLASTLPEYPGTIMLAAAPRPRNAWPSPEHPFYALETEQIPSDLYRERVLQSRDSQHWSLLPPLPVSGVSDERRGILQVLAVLPDGRLAVWGTDPRLGLPAPGAIHEPMSPFWLWLWDPVARQWQTLPLPLNVTAPEGCGLCWTAEASVSADDVAYLSLRYEGLGMTSQALPGVLRVRLPGAG